MLELKFAIYHR